MKSNKLSLMLLATLMMITIAACGGTKFEPQAINEETDLCEVCKMAVQDNQFATQIVTKDGKGYKFDDLGCMNEWMSDHGTNNIGAAYVRDFHGKQWILQENAFYVYDESFPTPMAYGVLAFEKEADAKAYIEEQGTGALMTAAQLSDHSWEVNHDMMHGHDHDHDHSHDTEGKQH